jgi:hypothetical protein
MAIPWLTLLSSVPWKDVISNAPKVADGAKQLWKSVARKTSAAKPAAASGEMPARSVEVQTIDTLDTRIIELQAEVSSLNEAMLASSQVIQALAEQNTQLIKSLAIFRGRVLRLGLLTALLTLLALAALYRTFP